MNKTGLLLFVATTFAASIVALASLILYAYELNKHLWLLEITVAFLISVLAIEIYKNSGIKEWDMQKTLLGIVIVTLPITATIGGYLFIGAVYVVGVLGVAYKQFSVALYPEHRDNLERKYSTNLH
jgi:hypothetical protein